MAVAFMTLGLLLQGPCHEAQWMNYRSLCRAEWENGGAMGEKLYQVGDKRLTCEGGSQGRLLNGPGR